MFGVSIGLVEIFLKDHFGLKRVKFSLYKKKRRVKVCEEVISAYQNIYKHMIVGDLIWI